MLIRFEVPSSVDQLFDVPAFHPAIAPNTDVFESENETIVSMEVPGVEKSDIKVSFERNILTVLAERKAPTTQDQGRVVLQERGLQSYRRALRIQHAVEPGAIKANLEHGILRITLPKAEAAKPRVVEVR